MVQKSQSAIRPAENRWRELAGQGRRIPGGRRRAPYAVSGSGRLLARFMVRRIEALPVPAGQGAAAASKQVEGRKRTEKCMRNRLQ